MFFGTDDGFNYFSFSTFGYLKNRENKAVSNKPETSVSLHPVSGLR